jgi:hypothetical protein
MLELERTVMNRQLQIAPQFSSDLTALSEPSLPRFRLLDAASWGHHKIPRSQRQGGDVSLDLQKKMIHLAHARGTTRTCMFLGQGNVPLCS